MKLSFVLVILCCIRLSNNLPVPDEKTDDLCELEELEDIPTCEANDEKCNERNDKKRAKRQTLCEKNPSCEFCGTLIQDSNLSEVVAESVMEPEITDPIKMTPKKSIERNIIIENKNETQYYRGYVESAANITTVIRLTNQIHNENIINMPTTLNNTNINNIHVHQNDSSEEGGKYGLGYTEKGSCCYAIQPKSCKYSTGGLKCHQKRSTVCGRQCTQKIIHLKEKPCMNTPQWPHWMCSQNNQQYQPGFNPGFYLPPPSYPGFYSPQSSPFDDEFDDIDDLLLFPTDEDLDTSEDGWIVSPEKCKVVSEDGLEINNCTGTDAEFEHPFARNTVKEQSKRHTRQTDYGARQYLLNQYQMMPQNVMYQQPVYFQPMQMLMPQFYSPPSWPVDNYYQAQVSSPYTERFDYNVQESEKYDSSRIKQKRVKKHHQNVMDIDEDFED